MKPGRRPDRDEPDPSEREERGQPPKAPQPLDAEHLREEGREQRHRPEEQGDRRGVAYAVSVLALMAMDRGDFDEAERRYETCLGICRAVDDMRGVAGVLHNLGEIALRRGDAGRSEQDVVDRKRQRPLVDPRAHRRVALRIEVDDDDALAAPRQPGGEVQGRRRLADAALLVRDAEGPGCGHERHGGSGRGRRPR